MGDVWRCRRLANLADLWAAGGASNEAEEIMTKAEKFMTEERSKNSDYLARRAALEKTMQQLLPGDDPIWARWFLKTHGGLPK